MSEENNIPNNWKIKKLEEVGQIVSGGTPSTKVAEYWNGNISWISPADLSDYKKKYIQKGRKSISESGLKNSSTRVIPKGSVLFSSRAPIGYVVIAANEVCTNQGFKSVVPNDSIFSEYLFYYLKASKQKAENVANGTTFKEISLKAFAQLEIPLPPLPEQQAIVAKIEELFSDLDNGIQQLQKAQQQLKIYRQSLLKAAFEGKLSLNHDSSENCQNHDSSDLSDEHDLKKKGDNQGNHINQKNQGSDILPKGWKWVKLGTVLDKIEAGKSFKCDERTPQLDEVGVIKVSAVTWQVFNEYESKTVIEKDRINENYFIQKEDFLFSRANTLDLVGAVVIVNSIERKLMLSDKTLRFHFSPNVSKKFMLYYLRSKKGRNEIQRLSTGNQESMRNIGQERIKQIEFPFPPLSEQQLIVDELESKLTVCDKIEETIAQSLQQAETLKQSILKKAFSGGLINFQQNNEGSEKGYPKNYNFAPAITGLAAEP